MRSRPLLIVLFLITLAGGAAALPPGTISKLASPSVASAAAERPTLQQLEKEVMCPTCNQTLELSHAPIADRIRAFIVERIEAGDTSEEIKDELVLQFGERILAAPPKSGFNLLAWVLPFVGLIVAGAVVVVVMRRWRRARRASAAAAEIGPIDSALDQRIDDELARLDR